MRNERRHMEEQLIAYINHDLDAESTLQIERSIQEDVEVKKMYEKLVELNVLMQSVGELEPDFSLKKKFKENLDTEIRNFENKEKSRFLSFDHQQVLKIAAAFSLVITGLFIGLWIAGNNNSDNAEIASLREEIELTRKMMFEALSNSGSASARIHAVNASEHISQADPEIINVLIKTMNEDENTNVRLAAMRALARFETEETVKKAFVQSLEVQKDPILQITLINILVEINDVLARENLKKLIENNETLESVKDEAYLAIFRLS